MRWGSTFRMCLARILRMSWLPWLPRVRVQRFVDASNSATQARGSRKLVTRRLLTRLSEITRCAASKALSVFLTVTDLRIEGVARSLRPHARGSLRRRTLNPDGCVERLPVDRNGLRGRPRLLLGLRDDEGHGVSHMPDGVDRQHGIRRRRHARSVGIAGRAEARKGPEAGEILMGQHEEHAGHRAAVPKSANAERACAWGLRTTTP